MTSQRIITIQGSLKNKENQNYSLTYVYVLSFVVLTFYNLMEKGHPFYKYYYGVVTEVIKQDLHKVRFNLA